MQKQLLTLILILTVKLSSAQQQVSETFTFRDSIIVKVHPSYDNKNGFHYWLFGKNYRKEWATAVKLPVIRLSEVYGGLKPLKQGGGLQSKSLRLADNSGKEWVLRSVEKTPEKLLPEALQGTFAVDWIDDALSSQHPYSALVVPPLAQAAGVPYANPVIGMVADDVALGEYSRLFANTVCLLEEREPLGESDNTDKMKNNLLKSPDYTFDGDAFLRARMLDLLVGDWDRHEDQWRWFEVKEGKNKKYISVPRDRDQVFHLEQGLLPDIAALPYVNPLLGDFTADLPAAKYNLFKTRFLNPYPAAQMTHEHWMTLVNQFVTAETDTVLEAGLRRLPPETYTLRHEELLSKLKARRNNLPAAMDKYYKYIYRLVDIRLTNKAENISITDAPDNGLHISVNKVTKEGKVSDTILSMTYKPDITKEIRLFTSGGNDSILIDAPKSSIHLRLIGGEGNQAYNVVQSNNKVQVYDIPQTTFNGDTRFVSKHLSTDSLHTRFVQTNPYNIRMPLVTAALNADDGFLLGLGFKYTKNDGFRKKPYTSTQQVLVTHAFATDAFRIKVNGEWIKAIGAADFTLQAVAQAPDNTMNFFGFGNETPINKKPSNYRRFYRTRFDTYQFDPALRWHTGAHSTISVGPSFEFYHLDNSDNKGRLINNSALIGSYDSLTIGKDKTHLGFSATFNINKRNAPLLPTAGYYITISLEAYTGLNDYSKSFAQLRPEFTFYQKLNSNGSIVISDRVGGGIGVGKPAFYQAMFIGGQGNLLGYLQNRFAGEHMIYNNFQARVKLANIASYIIPGQLGVTGFYDVGRVWAKGDHSDDWHPGIGGGLYFSPASLTILQLLAGHSTEGWYPYFSFNLRF